MNTSSNNQVHTYTRSWSRRLVATGMAAAMIMTGAGCSGKQSGASPTSTTKSPEFSEVAREIDGFVAKNKLNGAGLVLVDKKSGVIFEHYTGAITANRISLIASSSKMLTAGILMRLADEGRLDLDAPISKVVDWGPMSHAITPAQLLSNSSGLVGLGSPDVPQSYSCQYVAGGSLQDCAKTLMTTPDDDAHVIAPDTKFRYGGAQWQVAGAVAEIASGKSWAQLVDETYVKPCGASSLAFNNHYTQIMSAAGPYSYPTPFDGKPSTLKATDNPNMEGGAYVTPGDYAKLLLMHLRGGTCGTERVLKSTSIDRLHADRIGPAYKGTTGGGKLQGYGLGWWVDRNRPAYTEDAGAFGAVPWMDTERHYAGYLIVEATAKTGIQLQNQILPEITRQLDRRG